MRRDVCRIAAARPPRYKAADPSSATMRYAAARAGLRKTSPVCGGWLPGRKTSAVSRDGLQLIYCVGSGPQFPDHLWNGKAAFRVGDRRLEETAPWELAESLMHLRPAIHRTRNSHRMDSGSGHCGGSLRGQEGARKSARRGPGCIETGERSRSFRPGRRRTDRRPSRSSSVRPGPAPRWPRSPHPPPNRPAPESEQRPATPAAGWWPRFPAARSPSTGRSFARTEVVRLTQETAYQEIAAVQCNIRKCQTPISMRWRSEMLAAYTTGAIDSRPSVSPSRGV